MIALATPVRGADPMTAQVTMGYAQFLAALHLLIPTTMAVAYCLDVVKARNRIAAHILTVPEFKDVEHVLWVDDDTYPDDPRVVPKMIEFAARTGSGIVGVPYTNKRKPVRWVHRVNERREVVGVGFGFTLTTREALQKVWEGSESYVDMPQSLVCRNMFGQVYGETQGKKVLLSEDYSFCVRALTADVKIAIYTEGSPLIYHSGPYGWTARDM